MSYSSSQEHPLLQDRAEDLSCQQAGTFSRPHGDWGTGLGKLVKC